MAALRASSGPCAVSIGTFDGVHEGHREVLRRCRRLAMEHGLRCVAMTFDPRPDQLDDPAAGGPSLCTLPERLRRLRAAGADDVVVLPFTRELRAVGALEFMVALRDLLGMEYLCVGEDFALGRGREGDVATLRALGHPVVAVELVRDWAGNKVSSSDLRRVRDRPSPRAASIRSDQYPFTS